MRPSPVHAQQNPFTLQHVTRTNLQVNTYLRRETPTNSVLERLMLMHYALSE